MREFRARVTLAGSLKSRGLLWLVTWHAALFKIAANYFARFQAAQKSAGHPVDQAAATIRELEN